MVLVMMIAVDDQPNNVQTMCDLSPSPPKTPARKRRAATILGGGGFGDHRLISSGVAGRTVLGCVTLDNLLYFFSL
jgi:hypothetical protein